jgi:hypothetical protein
LRLLFEDFCENHRVRVNPVHLPNVAAQAEHSPEPFLSVSEKPLIIDEVQ